MKIGRIGVATALSCSVFGLLGGASALASQVPTLTINGKPSNGPVTGLFGVNTDEVADAGGIALTIMSGNDNTAGNLITGISGVVASSNPPLGYAGFNDPLPAGQTLQGNPYVPVGCDVTSTSFQCSGMSITPGAQLQIDLTAIYPGQPVGMVQSVDIQVNDGTFGACLKPDAIFDAHVADNCDPPKHTKITSAKIQGNKAFFTFKAQNASGYRSQLFQSASKKLMYSSACNSGKKPYSNALPAGKYAFEVRGTNGAGYAKKPAVKVFTAS